MKTQNLNEQEIRTTADKLNKSLFTTQIKRGTHKIVEIPNKLKINNELYYADVNIWNKNKDEVEVRISKKNLIKYAKTIYLKPNQNVCLRKPRMFNEYAKNLLIGSKFVTDQYTLDDPQKVTDIDYGDKGEIILHLENEQIKVLKPNVRTYY